MNRPRMIALGWMAICFAISTGPANAERSDSVWPTDDLVTRVAEYTARYRVLHRVSEPAEVPPFLHAGNINAALPLYVYRQANSEAPTMRRLFSWLLPDYHITLVEAIHRHVKTPGLESFLLAHGSKFDQAYRKFIDRLGLSEVDEYLSMTSPQFGDYVRTTYAAIKPHEDMTNIAILETLLRSISDRRSKDMHELVFLAEPEGHDLLKASARSMQLMTSEWAHEVRIGSNLTRQGERDCDFSNRPLTALLCAANQNYERTEDEIDPYKDADEELKFFLGGYGWCSVRAADMQCEMRERKTSTMIATIRHASWFYDISPNNPATDPKLEKACAGIEIFDDVCYVSYSQNPESKVDHPIPGYVFAPQYRTERARYGVYSMQTNGKYAGKGKSKGDFSTNIVVRSPRSGQFYVSNYYGQQMPVAWDAYLTGFSDREAIAFVLRRIDEQTIADAEQFPQKLVDRAKRRLQKRIESRHFCDQLACFGFTAE